MNHFSVESPASNTASNHSEVKNVRHEHYSYSSAPLIWSVPQAMAALNQTLNPVIDDHHRSRLGRVHNKQKKPSSVSAAALETLLLTYYKHNNSISNNYQSPWPAAHSGPVRNRTTTTTGQWSVSNTNTSQSTSSSVVHVINANEGASLHLFCEVYGGLLSRNCSCSFCL